jgi:hypothetical protein
MMGGQNHILIVGALAAAPFLQAVATHFGNRFAGALDEGTRTAVRRLLRRQVEESREVQGLQGDVQSVTLRTEHGWLISISEDLPAEAVAQLIVLCSADPPTGKLEGTYRHDEWRDAELPRVGIIAWNRSVWRTATFVRGRVKAFAWDAAENCWTNE